MGYAVPEIDESSARMIEIPNLTGTPERRLLLAMIERAILDFVGNDVKEMQEAGLWIFGDSSDEENEAEDHIQFSFGWVCQQLDLDKADIRKKINAMPKRGESRLAPWYMAKAS